MREKHFIPPKYTETNFDNDLDDDDDDLEDDIFDEESESDQELESYLDSKDKENNSKNKNQRNMQSTPFGQTVNQGGSNWGNNNFGGSNWGQSMGNNWGQKPWGQPIGSSWQPSGGSSWGSNWGSSSIPNSNPWNNNSFTSKKESIDRTKKVIFCDLLDCLVETFQSNGKPGLLPRGVYDIRLRFEVWDKLRCFGAEKIYVTTPKLNFITNNGTNSWVVLMNYVICSLSEYLRVPFENCQIISQNIIGQDKKNLINYVISSMKIDRSDILMIGLNSGLVGQSDIDKLIAEDCDIDYIDLSQLMSLYF